MDKLIDNSEINKQKRSQWLKYGLLIAAVAAAAYLFRNKLSRSADANEFNIVSVTRGDMLNTLTASGVVVAASELSINAPVPTEIKRVLIGSGRPVKKGDLIMQLDEEYTRLNYEQLKDELSLKKNNVDKLKLEYDKNLVDLGYQDQIKALRLDELRSEVADRQQLQKVGGATIEEVEQAQLALKIAEIEKKMLENELQYKQNVNSNDKRSLELEYTIQEKKLKELSRKLRETSVRAPRNGVITWINEDIGRKVNTGEPLVRIANLDRYRVEAFTSDRNSQKINIGQPVKVKINQREVDGSITTILPEVENNRVKFIVELADAASDILRPNIRADVNIIVDQKDNVLQVRKGQAFKGASVQDIFVIQGDKAVKRRIEKGIVNSDGVEIISGLAEGDRIIITDTEEYNHLSEFTIKK